MTSTTITHVVLADWNDGLTAESLEELDRLVAALPTEVDGISEIVWGPSVSTEGLEDGFDWALVITFTDAAARDAYLPHPAHAPVAERIGAWSSRVVVFDVAS